MNATTERLLRDLVLHLDYDADHNGTRAIGVPCGAVRLWSADNEDWTMFEIMWLIRDLSSAGILKEVVEHLLLHSHHCVHGGQRGFLVLSEEEGSLWQRMIKELGYMPDMIRDVVRPAILAELRNQTRSDSPS
jgi:hypothetical protein